MIKYYLVMSYELNGSPKVKREVTAEHARTLKERAGIKCEIENS